MVSQGRFGKFEEATFVPSRRGAVAGKGGGVLLKQTWGGGGKGRRGDAFGGEEGGGGGVLLLRGMRSPSIDCWLHILRKHLPSQVAQLVRVSCGRQIWRLKGEGG